VVTTGSGAENGVVRLTISSCGLFTGRLYLAGRTRSFTGQFNVDGEATVTIAGADPVTISLEVDLSGGGGGVTGSIAGGADGLDGAEFTLGQSTFNGRTNVAPQAGRYTLVLGSDLAITGSAAPQGDGYAAVVIGANGAATVAGRLADGTPYSATGTVANDGSLTLYFVPSGEEAGSSVEGLLTFRTTDASDLDGTLTWTKAPKAGDAFYPGGFTIQMPVAGSHYTRPAAGLQPMDASPGAVTAALGGGNIPQPINVPVTVDQQNRARMVTPGLPDVTLSINAVSGAVSGSFVLPGGNVTRALRGVVFQKQQSAFGYFRGLDQCGYFSLTPGS
jgi:hypothetical protein